MSEFLFIVSSKVLSKNAEKIITAAIRIITIAAAITAIVGAIILFLISMYRSSFLYTASSSYNDGKTLSTILTYATIFFNREVNQKMDRF
jgi:uncharacterized membrane protein